MAGRRSGDQGTSRKKSGRSVNLSLPWFLFYGRVLNMSRQEILITPYSEMIDMITCLSIYNGTMSPDTTKTVYDFDTAIQAE